MYCISDITPSGFFSPHIKLTLNYSYISMKSMQVKASNSTGSPLFVGCMLGGACYHQTQVLSKLQSCVSMQFLHYLAVIKLLIVLTKYAA